MEDGTLVVIGLGYVGLPLAVGASAAGWLVRGLDASHGVVESLRAGRSHVDDVDDAAVRHLIDLGFEATTDSSVIADSDVVVICVPTPLGPEGDPDLTAVRCAVTSIAPHLRAGMLVVLESTTYPGTTDEIVRPMLETDDLKAGVDFGLAFSPERIDPGNADYGIRNTPKVVGGITPECTETAAAFYETFVDTVVRARGTREAEMAKLLENTFRHVNIALVNEMARFCHDLDIDLWDVIACAATKPFGFAAFYPGPGVGGHCIPVDPTYLSHRVKTELGYPFRFVELAEDINAGMPAYVVSRVQSLLNQDRRALNGSSILLLGVTYKADIADLRESPSVPIATLLRESGAEVSFLDPFVDEWVVDGLPVRRCEDLERELESYEVCVLLANHAAFDLDHLARHAQRLFDTRGVVARRPGVHRL